MTYNVFGGTLSLTQSINPSPTGLIPRNHGLCHKHKMAARIVTSFFVTEFNCAATTQNSQYRYL